MMRARYITKSLTFGSYAAKDSAPKIRTHTVMFADASSNWPWIPLCRVNPDALEMSADTAGTTDAPTCPTCRKHDPRFAPGMRGVVRADRSPMNERRWCLTLECGHEEWVNGRTRPKAKTYPCGRCGPAVL
jgi:hypothetical protein